MSAWMGTAAARWRRPAGHSPTASWPGRDAVLALVGAASLGFHAAPAIVAMATDASPAERASAADAPVPSAATGGARYVLGAYGGTSYTYPSVVRITKPAVTDLTVKDFAWDGLPFKSPIYYGLRLQRWPGAAAGFGAMVDFTHAKTIARADDMASFSGTRDGQPVAPKARIGDVFKHLEFSHGHNMVTLNGLARLPILLPRIRPYIGIGGGITLPHTEVGFRNEQARTYEYQFAGFVGQALGGIEVNLGRVSVFLEYKFSWAPYEVPLSHEPTGFILFTDLWRQFRAWALGLAPPGGRLSTQLATHHGISGVLLPVGAAAAR